MPPMQGTFDAGQFKPNYGFDKVMPGKYPARITNTEIQPTKDQSGGMFIVTFQTPAGSIQDRYNLWNSSPKAVEIAHGQLSALCHVTGVFRLDWANEGAALRNAECMIDVGWQKGNEPTPENPNGGYTEIKKLYDKNGNEPGKSGAAPQPQTQQWAPQQQQPQAAPMTQQPGGGWGAPPNSNGAPANPAPTPNPQPAWGAGQGPAPQQQANPPATPQGWTPQNPQSGTTTTPPWGR